MEIRFYNKDTTKVSPNIEGHCIYPCVLIADKVMFNSISACIMIIYVDLDKLTISKFIEVFRENAEENDETSDEIATLVEMDRTIKKLNQLKHKDKKAISTLHLCKSAIQALKLEFKDFLEENLIGLNMFSLIGFVEKGIIELKPMGFFADELKEDTYIQEISNTLTEQKDILLLDDSIEKLFSFSLFNSAESGACDFIKIPLWDFPPFSGLSFEQMNYTREQLKPAMASLVDKIKILSQQIFPLSWGEENLNKIKQLCTEIIEPQIATVQQAIDESLYLIKQRNSFSAQTKIKCCLAIASAETLVNYYEKNEIVLPYVASELKDQIGKHIDLKASIPFFYFEISEEVLDTISTKLAEFK